MKQKLKKLTEIATLWSKIRTCIFPKIAIIVSAASMQCNLKAADLAKWDFTGDNPATAPFNSTSISDVTATNLSTATITLTRGPGAAASAGGNSFRTVGFQNNGISTSNTDYFQTTLAASAGYALSLSSIDAYMAGTTSFSNSPGTTNQFAYSLDGTNFTLIGSPLTRIGNGALPQIDVSGVSALQNVTSSTTITLRFYASGQTTTGGWGFNSTASGAYGLAIGGTVAVTTDTTPPTLSSTSPADNATGVTTTANLVATFSETVQKGTSGNVIIKKTTDNSVVETIDITTTAVTVAGAVVTIDPSVTLDFNTEYYVTIDANAFKDNATSPNNYDGLSSTTAWSFTTAASVDNTAPTLTSTSPIDDATGISTTANLVATFDETVQKGTSGNVIIKKTSDNSVVDTIDITTTAVTVAGAVVTIDPAVTLNNGTEYYVTIDANAFKDNATIPNNYIGLSSTTAWSFTTVAAASPGLVINEIYGGGGNASAVLLNDFVELYNGTASAIDLSTYSLQYTSATGTSWSSNQLNLTGSIAAGQHYLIKLASGGANGSALPTENISGTINMSATAGKVALVSSQTALTGANPLPNATIVDFVGYGATADAFETATAPAPSVTNSISRTGGVDSGNNSADFTAGTPTPTAGPIVDTTPPTLASTSPADNDTGVSTTANLVATFSETVQKGTSGNVIIKKTSDNTVVETIDITTTAVTVAGAVVTIDPAVTLDMNTEYYVTIDANAFKDNATSPNNYAGLSTTTAWSFTTAAAVDSTPPTLITTSPIDNATGVSTTANLIATFDETVQKGTAGNVIIKKTSDNSIVETIDITTAAVTVAGAVITIDPTVTLDNSTEYYVTIDANAFKDNATSPNNYAGLSSTTDWSFTTAAPFIAGQVVISQVYGGGGNTGAQYTNDFIELHNNSAVTVNITGWSVQYASATGTFNNKTDLSGSIPPGGYYLVQGASGANGSPLPTPDATGTLNLSATNGKVALVNATTLLGAGLPTDPTVSDFVGFGTASLWEGTAAAPAGSNTLAVVRQNAGTLDTNVNSFDFVTAVPAPRNSATPPFTATADGSGIATIANLNLASPLLNSPIFGRNLSSQTAAITLTGTFPGSTITDVTIEVPAAITGLLVGNVSLTGAGSATVAGNTITITGAAVTTTTGLTVTITGLSTPDTSTDITNDGNYPFVVSTAQSGGTLTALSTAPIAYVVIPIANIRDQDANGVPLDLNDKVAVQGVCTEEDFNSSATITSAFLQEVSGSGVNIFSNSVDSPYLRGNEYVTLGNVIQFNGLTEVSFTSVSTSVFNLGVAVTQPTPITLTLATLMLAPETYEGKLVTIVNLSPTDATGWPPATVIPLTDDGGTTTLNAYIHSGSTATTSPAFPAAITGVFGQFDNAPPLTAGYQIHPRDPSDIVSSGLTAYQTWATGAPYNLTGNDALFNADPDMDGIVNGIEFIVGSNPTVANDASAFIPNVTVAGAPSSRVATIVYRRTDASIYLNSVLQISPDLVAWSTPIDGFNGASIVVADDFYGAGIDKVTVTLDANGPRGFVRLCATATP